MDRIEQGGAQVDHRINWSVETFMSPGGVSNAQGGCHARVRKVSRERGFMSFVEVQRYRLLGRYKPMFELLLDGLAFVM